MHSEDELLPLSALIDIVFCERSAALHQVEQVWEENVATIEGHNLHDKTHDSSEESRGDTKIARGLRLRSLRLGLCGVADVVEFHRAEKECGGAVLSGAAGRWTPFPVEYKRGVRRHELSFEVQLCAQALCLEEMLNCAVTEGAIFYGISRRRQEVMFSDELRTLTERAAERLHALVAAGVTPAAKYEKKCRSCSLFSLCMPKSAGIRKSAVEYLERMAAATVESQT